MRLLRKAYKKFNYKNEYKYSYERLQEMKKDLIGNSNTIEVLSTC